MIVLLILSLKAVQRQFPNALLHWEDFGRNNATKILKNMKMS